MRRQVFRRSATGLALFPFLAVLICTMGSLIVLLVLVLQQSRAHAQSAAESERAERNARRQEDSQEDQQRRQLLEDIRWRQEVLEEQRAKQLEDLAQRRLELAHLEDHIRRLRDQADVLGTQIAQLDQDSTSTDEQQRLREQLSKLRDEIKLAQEKLEAARLAASKKSKSYTIIPYEGRSGTRRRPIYIECAEEGIILHPENIVFQPSDFEGPLGPGNPLDAALRTVREYLARYAKGQEAGEPYPLLVVRPNGAIAYSMARRAMKSWDDEFGYELIDAETELRFPPSDPQLEQLLLRTLNDARHRQAVLAASMPSRFRQATDGSDELVPDTAMNESPVVRSAGGAGAGGGSGGAAGSKGEAGLGGASGGTGNGLRNGSGGLSSSSRNAAGGAGPGGSGTGASDGRNHGSGGGIVPGSGSGSGNGNGNGLAGGPGPGSGRGPGGGSGSGSGGGSGGGTGRGSGTAYGYGGGSGGQADEQGNGAEGEGAAESNGLNAGNTSGGSARGGGTAGGGTADGAKAGAFGASSAGGGGGTPGGGAPSGMQGMGAGSPSLTFGSAPAAAGAAAGDPATAAKLAKATGAAGGGAPGGSGGGKFTSNDAQHTKGRDWALPPKSLQATAITRPIRVRCEPDRLLILPERGDRNPVAVVAVPGPMRKSLDDIVKVLRKEMDKWGLAVVGGYWKPVLNVTVVPGAESRYDELEDLLRGSGIDVVRR